MCDRYWEDIPNGHGHTPESASDLNAKMASNDYEKFMNSRNPDYWAGAKLYLQNQNPNITLAEIYELIGAPR